MKKVEEHEILVEEEVSEEEDVNEEEFDDIDSTIDLIENRSRIS